MSDPTTHGAPLAPGPGSVNVLIGYMPAWRAVIDQHACPAVNITGADGVGSVVMGSPTVLINNMMACRMGDIVIEKPGLALGPANPIIMGCPTVMIGEVGMGGAGTPFAGAAKSSKAAVVMASSPSGNATKLSKGGKKGPAPTLGPPPSFHKPKPKPHKDAPEDPTIICELIDKSPKVHCQHGRYAVKPEGLKGKFPPDGVLQVVGSTVGDTITCESQNKGGCGKHPLWDIEGYMTSEKVATNTSFLTRTFRGVPETAAFLPIWLGSIAPHVYTVSVGSCSGTTGSFEIQSYPNDNQEWTASQELMKKRLEPPVKFFKKYIAQLISHPIVEIGTGSIQATAQWKEDGKSNAAFYAWSLNISMNPLIALGGRKIFSPTAVLPAWLTDYANGGLFLELKGEINLKGEGGRLNPPSADGTKNGAHFDVKAEANALVSAGGTVYAGDDPDDPKIKVEVSLQSGLKFETVGEIHHGKPVLKRKFIFPGLKGMAVFTYYWGSKKGEVSLIGETEFGEGEWEFFAEPGASGEGSGE